MSWEAERMRELVEDASTLASWLEQAKKQDDSLVFLWKPMLRIWRQIALAVHVSLPDSRDRYTVLLGPCPVSAEEDDGIHTNNGNWWVTDISGHCRQTLPDLDLLMDELRWVKLQATRKLESLNAGGGVDDATDVTHLLTTLEAKEKLRMDRGSVCRACRDGKLVASKNDSGVWSIDAKSVLEYKRNRDRQSQPAKSRPATKRLPTSPPCMWTCQSHLPGNCVDREPCRVKSPTMPMATDCPNGRRSAWTADRQRR